MIIDPEFATLLSLGSDTENDLLEAELVKAGGPRDPLIIWAGTGLLVDGHRRWRLIEKHGLSYTTQEVEFESRDAVIKWILLHQLSRRSLSEYERVRKLKELVAAMNGKKDDRVQQAAAVVGVSARSVYRMLEVGKVAERVIPQFRDYMNCIGRDTLHKLGRQTVEEQMRIYQALEAEHPQKGLVCKFVRKKLNMKEINVRPPAKVSRGRRKAEYAGHMKTDRKDELLGEAIRDAEALVKKLDDFVTSGLIKSGDLRVKTVGAVRDVVVCLKWIQDRFNGRKA
jgi:hypothetical protein